MQGKTVLVIEDSPELSASIEDILELEGIKSITTSAGSEGVSLALQHHPDLILLDIRLPDIDGYEVYRRIREDTAWGASAKITILTASESLENISKNINLPLEHILFKPEQSVTALLDKITSRLID